MILASASPRRKEILENLNISFTIHISNISEKYIDGETPAELVERLAREKALAVALELVAARKTDLVLGADTVVSLGNSILGKPHTAEEAQHMLESLSGQTHTVYTGICLASVHNLTVELKSYFEKSTVTFKKLSSATIDAYVASGQPFDKAGGYGIQGPANAFVENIEGERECVVGLPIKRLMVELKQLNVEPK